MQCTVNGNTNYQYFWYKSQTLVMGSHSISVSFTLIFTLISDARGRRIGHHVRRQNIIKSMVWVLGQPIWLGAPFRIIQLSH